MNNLKNKKGFGLIEIVISVAVISTVFSAFFFFYRQALILSQKTTSLVQTNMLLVEGVEVVKFLRDDSWSTNLATLATSTPHYLLFTSGDWEIAATSSAPIDGIYTRWFELEDVYRDGNDDIASVGTYDSGILKLTMYVSAIDRDATSTESVLTYVTDIFGN